MNNYGSNENVLMNLPETWFLNNGETRSNNIIKQTYKNENLRDDYYPIQNMNNLPHVSSVDYLD